LTFVEEDGEKLSAVRVAFLIIFFLIVNAQKDKLRKLCESGFELLVVGLKDFALVKEVHNRPNFVLGQVDNFSVFKLQLGFEEVE
jgi:hypothetical protein